MSQHPLALHMERVVRDYFQACKKGDAEAIAACFTPDAVQYFAGRSPWVGSEAFGKGIVQAIDKQGGYWTVDNLYSDVEQNVVTVEWSKLFRERDRISRGLELYVFDLASGLIREARVYYAATPDTDKKIQELVDFDYASRGYPTHS